MQLLVLLCLCPFRAAYLLLIYFTEKINLVCVCIYVYKICLYYYILIYVFSRLYPGITLILAKAFINVSSGIWANRQDM